MSDPVRPDTRSAPPPPVTTPEAAGVVARFDALRRALEGRYVLERELASGAMGVVLCARDLRHDRPVAVKVLRPELATATGADRFLREVRTAAGLLHPGIVTVYDSGEAGGLLYYVMPMVEGEALRERLERERSLPLTEAVRIARQVAEALAFAHARGIVHRDIKPENILLATHGHAQVTDFGVARALSEAEVRLTGTGAILGSPLYLSPEQAAGTRVDGRADVYSLGCVLYEMLVGVAPFEGSLAAVLTGHLTAAPPSACARRPDLPPAIDELIRRALVKLPEERLSAQDMAEALAQLPLATLNGSSPILPPPPSAPGPLAETLPETAPAARSSPRTRTLLLAGAALAVLGVGSFVATRPGGVLRAYFPAPPPPDSTRYAVFPFRHDASVPASLAEADRVRDELARWQGLDVIDAGDAAAVLTRADSAGVDPARALSLARQLRAGRFVTGRITREGDSLRI
ncbi:MAG TPA: serine/threonine-protein kinase, partial [Longimicrobiales bacterium]